MQLGEGLLPRAPLLVPRVGTPQGRPWEPTFMEAILRWVASLMWLLGQGHSRSVELALDMEAHAGRALLAPGGSHCPCAPGDTRHSVLWHNNVSCLLRRPEQ